MTTDDDFESLEETRVSFTDSAQQSYMMRCEHTYWMEKCVGMMRYLVFCAVCFMVYLAASTPSITKWSAGVLSVWAIVSIIWGIIAVRNKEKHPRYDLIETPK